MIERIPLHLHQYIDEPLRWWSEGFVQMVFNRQVFREDLTITSPEDIRRAANRIVKNVLRVAYGKLDRFDHDA